MSGLQNDGGLKRIVDAAFDRAKVTMLALVVLAFLGLNTYQTAPREGDPDITLPFIQVLLVLPGISPEDAERQLIQPAEEELRNLEGLKQMDASAFDSAATFRLEFEAHLSMEDVLVDVREAVDRAKNEFPPGTEEPVVEELNAQSLIPVITAVVSGDVPERTLIRAAKELEDAITALPGVLEVTTAGTRDELIEITITPETLENYQLTPDAIAGALQANNALVTAGNMRFDDGSYAVKLPGLLKTLDDIRQIPLQADETGVVTLGEIATVRRTFEEATSFARFNGRPAIGLDVAKRGTANLVELSEAVKAEAAAISDTWPETLTISFIGEQSALVTSIFSGLTSSILLAILLVMIVVVAALGIQSALLVGIAIPASFLIGLALIGMFGFTMNQLVMFSMVLSVGMLVDGAIVIVELADRRMAEGLSRRQAFQDASKRMFWPIIASTATTLAAFVPFLFWQSIEGYFLRWIPITLILVLMASLAVALVFLPIIGSAFAIPSWMKNRFGIKGQTDRQRADLDNIDPRELPGFTGRYARLIDNLARRPVVVIGCGIAVVFGCFSFFGASNVAVEQFLRVDNERVLVFIKGRGNISETETLRLATDVQNRVISHPAVEYAYLQTGPQIARGRDAPIDALALVNLDLVPYQEREHSLEVVDDLRSLVAGVPGVVIEVTQPEQGPPVGKDVQVELTATSFEEARQAGLRVRAFMAGHTTDVDGQTVPTFMDLSDNLPLPGIELGLVPDREEAGRYGLSIRDIGRSIQLVTEGVIVDRFRPDDSREDIDIRLRFPEEARQIQQLTGIKIATPAGNVPLANFTTLEPRQKVDQILRRDGNRVIDIMGDANVSIPTARVSQDIATLAVAEWLEAGGLAKEFPGVQYRLRGAAEKTAETGAFYQGAMFAALMMIGVILLLQFNSFYHALLTLSAVILSVAGVLLGIALSGQYVSQIMTGIGIVALAGIVVNNNIVLIDTYQSLRAIGLQCHEAVVRTAAQRMRPVLLTTVTTIIGLLPMVFEIDIDFSRGTIGIGNETSDWWVLLSSAIVYGLAFATLLTLLLTPVLLAAPTVLSARMKSLFSNKALLTARSTHPHHDEADSLATAPQKRRTRGRDDEPPFATAAE